VKYLPSVPAAGRKELLAVLFESWCELAEEFYARKRRLFVG
jgi:hypothetical protein